MLVFENVDGIVGDVLKSFVKPDEDLAIVFGLVVLNTNEFHQFTYQGAKWLAHESRHGAQSDALGGFYLPAHIGFNLTIGYDRNPLEQDAREYANRNWWRFYK